ncbi:MAG: hypothetical protein FJ128_09170 [Deltaproteobacteria bacterium]|nr:hypothetical protein [Deltaproteobacteria bacterium]
MKFLVDAPLGGLAKWLRFCGFDVEVKSLSGTRPERLPPAAPGRHILTGQASLARRGRPDILLVAGAAPEAQLREVCRRLGLDRRDFTPLSRCVRCNRELAELPRDQAWGRVPEHVFLRQTAFYECPACRRVFWPGSHAAKISAHLNRACGDPGEPVPHPGPEGEQHEP